MKIQNNEQPKPAEEPEEPPAVPPGAEPIEPIQAPPEEEKPPIDEGPKKPKLYLSYVLGIADSDSSHLAQ